jgi:hypothetical protein
MSRLTLGAHGVCLPPRSSIKKSKRIPNHGMGSIYEDIKASELRKTSEPTDASSELIKDSPIACTGNATVIDFQTHGVLCYYALNREDPAEWMRDSLVRAFE